MDERLRRSSALGARADIDVTSIRDGVRVLVRAQDRVEEELRAPATLERQRCAIADWPAR